MAGAGYRTNRAPVFDTLHISGGALDQAAIAAAAADRQINLLLNADGSVGVSLDETVTLADMADLFAIFGLAWGPESDGGGRRFELSATIQSGE